MGNKKQKPREIRNERKKVFPNKADSEYIEIASTQPLELADSMSRTNHGRKFRNLSEWERYNRLRESFKTIGLRLLKQTDLRGKELDEAIIKEMLKDENLSREDRTVLQNKLPGNDR